MPETVVSIMKHGDGAGMLMYLHSASAHKNADDSWPLALEPRDMPPLNTNANVTNYGKKVREALEAHPAIKHELDGILALSNRSTLKFLIKAPKAECFRWESLYVEPARFLAMSDACAISRVTPAKIGPGLRAFTYPLRMVAFLSAAGIGAKPELEKILEQVEAARNVELNIECTVYLGEQQLLNDVQNEIAHGALNGKGITAEPIPATATEIASMLRDASIQFLHFFCHGIDRFGVQGLSLATIGDHDMNNANGNAATASIFLSTDALSEALGLNNSIWITVLNSCSGANAPLIIEQLYSMAMSLAKKGCPYGVGMAEPIDRKAATTFTEAFYGELFTIIRSNLAEGAADAPFVLDLSPAIIPARKMLFERCCAAPDAFGRWLLPLVYERALQPLVVQEIPPPMARRIQEVAQALRSWPTDTPVSLRDQVLKILDNDPTVPERLRPDRYGTFV
jgi:hypothetical protein